MRGKKKEKMSGCNKAIANGLCKHRRWTYILVYEIFVSRNNEVQLS